MMNVLVLGSGGRENAIAWKIAQSKRIDRLFCLPGNPGTASFATNLKGKLSDFSTIAQIVKENSISMVVVGPEAPLVDGLRDYFESDPTLADILFIGPSSAGARLEGSKHFAKDFMFQNNIPTAAYKCFGENEIEQAKEFLHTLRPPYVLKADGLAAGKGVLIINDFDEAVSSLEEIFGGKFGSAGNCVVIEQFLSGIECSVFVLTDGEGYMVLPEAKDYKRIGDGDRGPNTGGMGAVSPVPFADEQFMEKVRTRIILPTLSGLKKQNIKYKGFLFLGLMNCDGDPYMIEYNVRMGDPETEAVMMRIESDFLSHLEAAAKGEISNEQIVISPMTALTIIGVSGGYPGDYVKGYPISGLDTVEGAVVFHSGTASRSGTASTPDTIVTAGGRVVAVTSVAPTVQLAREKSYSEIEKISFEGLFYRHDIGLDIINYR